MAEAVGIALAVAGLFPVCVDGFNLIKDCFTAPKNAEDGWNRIYIQSGVFITWGSMWEVYKGAEENSKLDQYLRSGPNTGQQVLTTLSAISDTFANARVLDERYGLRIKQKPANLQTLEVVEVRRGQDLMQNIRKREVHMKLLSRCKFALKDSKKFDDLAKRLVEFNDSLLKMCSERAADKIERAILQDLLSKQVDSQKSKSLSITAQTQSEERRIAGQRHKVYDILASSAAFKAKVQANDAISDPRFCQGEVFEHGDSRWIFNDGDATMSTFSNGTKVCFIEWKYYLDDSDLERDIERLGDVLCIEKKPAEFRILPCIGITKDALNRRYGVVFRLPAYLENFPRFSERGAVSIVRKPVSLFELLDNFAGPASARGILDLKIRFQLARQLVQSIYILHAVGWVHKNIRSKSVIFLPDRSYHDLNQPSQTQRKDFSHPYLCGFGRSRPHTSSALTRQVGPYLLTETTAKNNINLDIYQHPSKRLDPEMRYLPAFDIYSLGCVLLEIGFWQSLQSFDKSANYEPLDFQKRLLYLTKELEGQAGSTYAGAVRECLSIGPLDQDFTGRDTAQDILCWKVAAALDQCMA